MRHLKFLGTILIATLIFTLPSCMEDPEDAITISEDQTELITTRNVSPHTFKATYNVYMAISAEKQANDRIMVVEMRGKGESDCLGASEWHSNSRIDMTTKDTWKQTGTMIFKTINGDEVLGYYMGTAYKDLKHQLVGYGKFVLTRGEGKYRHISGEGTYEYVFSEDMIGQIVFDGLLDCPKPMTAEEPTPVEYPAW